MTPREIIAQALAPSGEGATSVELMFSDAILEALTSAGYRILGPGELDPETLEKCAEEVAGINVRNHPRLSPGSEMNAWWSGQEIGHDDALTAIRALAKEKQGC